MIPSSACPSWPPDRAANAAQEHRSYTTSWDTIRGRRERALLSVLPTYKETNVTLANRLAEHAFASVVRDLEGFGSSLNEKHRAALHRIVQTYSSMACGETTGRFAFDLPTGCGKTQSVIAWCQAVHELQSGHSVVIAASKVEELCELKRKLVEKGVPKESIGLIHSKHFDPVRAEEFLTTRDPSGLRPTTGTGRKEYASLPRTVDNETRPFLLVTHSRVQSRRTNVDLLNSFNGKPRDGLASEKWRVPCEQ